jgi:ABC-type Zn uptake system ZnuABC Zn-binding protein ZnuA
MGINQTKEAENLYNKNYKALKKKLNTLEIRNTSQVQESVE